jgi:hypothetical protein
MNPTSQKDKFLKILAPKELVKLELIAGDPVMIEALRKVLLFAVYNNGTIVPTQDSNPTRNWALAEAFEKGISDQALGSKIRATAEGVLKLEMGLNEIANFKVAAEAAPSKKGNPAV